MNQHLHQIGPVRLVIGKIKYQLDCTADSKFILGDK